MKLISIGVHENKMACSLRDNNVVVKETIWNYQGDGNIYDKYLEAIRKSLAYTRGYITEHKDYEVVVFEITNSVVVKWINTNQCGKGYRKDLNSIMTMIDDIPMRYLFCKVDKPRCNYDIKVDSGLSGVEGLIEGE